MKITIDLTKEDLQGLEKYIAYMNAYKETPGLVTDWTIEEAVHALFRVRLHNRLEEITVD